MFGNFLDNFGLPATPFDKVDPQGEALAQQQPADPASRQARVTLHGHAEHEEDVSLSV
jgi:hypothetical protein